MKLPGLHMNGTDTGRCMPLCQPPCAVADAALSVRTACLSARVAWLPFPCARYVCCSLVEPPSPVMVLPVRTTLLPRNPVVSPFPEDAPNAVLIRKDSAPDSEIQPGRRENRVSSDTFC